MRKNAPERAATTDRGLPFGHIEVTMKTAIAGARFSIAAGARASFPRAEANRLIASGQAEPV